MPNVKKSILQPKNDVVFKALFSRGKPRITQAMLEAILKMKIDKLELDKSTDLLNDNKDDKNGRLDLRAVINGNTECDIEVQLASNDNIAERFVYYWAKMYAANLKIGDTYSDLRKTISIIILDDDFKLTKNLEKPQTTWKIRENEELDLILTDYFEIIIIELPKVVKAYHKTPNDEVLQWMLFLDNPEKEEVSRIMEENKDIKEAKQELDRISQDDLLRRRVLNRTLEIADQLQMKKELEEARKELEEAKKEAQQAENEKENIIKQKSIVQGGLPMRTTIDPGIDRPTIFLLDHIVYSHVQNLGGQPLDLDLSLMLPLQNNGEMRRIFGNNQPEERPDATTAPQAAKPAAPKRPVILWFNGNGFRGIDKNCQVAIMAAKAAAINTFFIVKSGF